MAGKFQPPDSLDFSSPNTWPQWKKRFERYSIVSKLNKDENEVQVSTLLYCMGPESEQVYSNFKFTNEDDRNNFKKVMEKFDQHFIPQRNVIFERARFNQRCQEENESIEAYVRALFEFAEHCDFENRKEDFIRDRLVIGLRDKELSQYLQLEKNLTLSSAVDTCRHRELVSLQNSQTPVPSNADAVTRDKNPRGRGRGKSRGHYRGQVHSRSHKDRKQQTDTDICNRCGYNAAKSHASGKCPAKDARCRHCNKIGHFQNVCQQKKDVGLVQKDALTDMFLGSIEAEINLQPWYEELDVNSSKITFKLDSGADVSLIARNSYEKMTPKPVLTPTDMNLNGVSANINISGYFTAHIKRSDELECTTKIYVANHKTDNLLSRSTSVQLQLIKRLDSVSVFDGLGLMKCKPVSIVVKEDAEPYSLMTPRRVSEPLAPKVEEEIQRMLQQGVIVSVDKETDWCSPLVPVMKPNGKVRVCVDYN